MEKRRTTGMDTLDALRVAMSALSRNKLRSGLTMLGIVIGAAALILLVGAAQGASALIQKQIAGVGSNMLFVSSGAATRGDVHLGANQTKTLVVGDVEAILRECPAVRSAAPGGYGGAQVVFGNDNWSTTIQGTTPSYFEVRSWQIQYGDAFTQQDIETAADVAVIGDTIRKNLFGAVNPVGQIIRINHLPFKVVGVLEPKGQSSMMGQDQDDVIFAPITTLQKKLTGKNWLNYIVVSALSPEASFAAQEEIRALLRDRHRILPWQDDDFTVRNMEEVAEMAARISLIMTILLACMASISLIVGGIGIMNIMLVSVTERTREIGVRLAVGATDTDIQRQFLIEAVVLSLLGAGVGAALGSVVALLASRISGYVVPISPLAILVAVSFSAVIGVFFGFYPARTAARLDPIEALRFE
jgi:putative ABC transport system permease protein